MAQGSLREGGIFIARLLDVFQGLDVLLLGEERAHGADGPLLIGDGGLVLGEEQGVLKLLVCAGGYDLTLHSCAQAVSLHENDLLAVEEVTVAGADISEGYEEYGNHHHRDGDDKEITEEYLMTNRHEQI